MFARILQVMFTLSQVSVLLSAEGGRASETQSLNDLPASKPRVLFITAKGNARCQRELAKLNRLGGDFDLMRKTGWKIGPGDDNHVQVVDEAAIPEVVKTLGVQEFPTVVCVSGGAIVRSFKSGCTTPLDRWTIGFLFKGVDERPPGSIPEAARVASTGNYPLRGNHWSIDEDWRPTKEKVISHLRGGAHAHQIQAKWAIESWSYEELRSLHDHLHEVEMGGVTFSNRSRPSDPLGAGRKTRGY